MKIPIPPGADEFPLDWPALAENRAIYQRMKNSGYTGVVIVSPDLQVQYANTGSVFVWNLFETPAYDAKKFAAMLDRALARHAAEQKVRRDKTITPEAQTQKLVELRKQLKKDVRKEVGFRLPPRGFERKHALEIFTLTGDYRPDRQDKVEDEK